MEELWALSHAKFLLQHIRIRHDLLWHDIKKQFCFFLYPELNEGFIFRLWLMPMFITMYLFKHFSWITLHYLYSSAVHNSLITWFSEVLILYLLGFFSLLLISLLFPLSDTWFWQLPGSFAQAETAEQQLQQSHVRSAVLWWAHRWRTATSTALHMMHLSNTHHRDCWAALNSPNKIALRFPPPSVRQSPCWRSSFGKDEKINGRRQQYFVSVVSPFQCGLLLATLGFFTPRCLCCWAFV